jgi:pimeloyl-ACP methyl ester carboxylesterase
LLALLGATPPPPAQTQSPEAEVRAALSLLAAHYETVAAKMGSDQALNLQERLYTDLGWMPDDTPAPGYSAAEWQNRVALEAQLDASIVSQAAAGRSAPVTATPGLTEHLVLSRVDGMLAPYALYVPANYAADPRLVVLLHGNPQTESALLGSRYFRDLADSTGTIIVAPYGRGIYDFAPPGGDEVYQVTDEITNAFHIPSDRVYLAGYSMGGFSVFKIGRLHPDRWRSVLDVAGAALGSEIDQVRMAFQHKQLFVVTGTADESIPTSYPQNTAFYLSGVGIATGLYIQRGGTHYIPTLWPMLQEAWHDMIAGRIRASAVPRGVASMQDTEPVGSDVPPGMRP